MISLILLLLLLVAFSFAQLFILLHKSVLLNLLHLSLSGFDQVAQQMSYILNYYVFRSKSQIIVEYFSSISRLIVIVALGRYQSLWRYMLNDKEQSFLLPKLTCSRMALWKNPNELWMPINIASCVRCSTFATGCNQFCKCWCRRRCSFYDRQHEIHQNSHFPCYTFALQWIKTSISYAYGHKFNAAPP